MAHLIFRCDASERVITTGITIDPEAFRKLHNARTMRCRFCAHDHPWELIEDLPRAAALLSIRAGDFLGRSVQSDAHAADARDPEIRQLYRRMAEQWYRLAVEHEDRAETLR